MPSGVGGFLTGMMSEQERLRTAAADQQKVARERFDAAWRQAGEIEAEINSPSYTRDRIHALIEKARVWDSAYRDQLGMSMVASVRSRLNMGPEESLKSPSIKFEGAGTAPSKSAAVIAQIKQMAAGGQATSPSFVGPPSPVSAAPAAAAPAASMAGWPSAQRRDEVALSGMQTEQKMVAAAQDAIYATTQLRKAYDKAIMASGGYASPQAELAVLQVSAQAEPLLGPGNVKSTEAVYLDTIRQMRSERMAAEARTQANIDKGFISASEYRLQFETLEKMISYEMGEREDPMNGSIIATIQGTKIMHGALTDAGGEMISLGLLPHEAWSRLRKMYGDENGVIHPVTQSRPKPWRQQMKDAPLAWQDAADSFYAAGNSPAQYAPAWDGNRMAMVDLNTGEAVELKVRSAAGVPAALDAGNYADAPAATPVAAAPAAAGQSGSPNPFERSVSGIVDATSQSFRGVGIAAESVIDLFNRRAGK